MVHRKINQMVNIDTYMVYSKVFRGRPPLKKRGNNIMPDENTRPRILAAARTIFAQKGFDGTSTRDVAKAAGVNNAMLYYYFTDKIGLYREVLAESFKEFDRIWDDEIFKTNASVEKKIRHYINELIRFQEANDELRRILSREFAACGENSIWLADRFFKRGYDRLAALFQEGMESGEIKDVNPSIAICCLVGMIHQAFILRPLIEYIAGKKQDLSVKNFGSFVTELLFEGIGKKKKLNIKRRSLMA